VKPNPDRKVEAGRYLRGDFGSPPNSGPDGAYQVQGPCGAALMIIANTASRDSDGWEHVSVSCKNRCPNWQEMNWVKDQFWNPDECVVQFHPPQSEYVNNHPYTLHMWRHIVMAFPMPPSILVGYKHLGLLTTEN
jgi:hypothetical protein